MNARCGAIALALAWLSLLIGFTDPVSADPLPGQIPKFFQLPLNNGAVPGVVPGTIFPGAPYFGHDELSTAYRSPTGAPVYTGTYMADDFADRFSTPVVHVRWWGSYLENFLGNGGVKDFLISFETDVPDPSPTNPDDFSHPGTPILNQVVRRVPAGPLAPGSGTFTEKPIDTPPMPGMEPRERLFEYNAELHLGKEFKQEPNTVYWLKIVALVDPQQDGQIQWGWHNRDYSIPNPLASTPPAPPGVAPGERIIGGVVDPAKGFESPVWHFQDDAVTGPIIVEPNPNMPNMPFVIQQDWDPTFYIAPWDLPSQYHNQFSKDLAFVLYTVPEPTSLMLLSFAALAAVAAARRR